MSDAVTLSLLPPRFATRFLLPITILFVISAAVRLARFDDRRMVSNIDASYHVLLTVEAMRETPIAEHHLLPIASLGRPMDKGIPFGKALAGPHGNYYYTSFPPLGFVLPWMYFGVTQLPVTVHNLMLFNLAIHLAATLLLALLVAEVTAGLRVERRTQALLVVLSAGVYLFSRETLFSHGEIYWHHSLFQVVLLLQLWSLARVLRALDNGEAPTRRDAAMLVATSFLGPSVEWTGYLYAAVSAALVWRRATDETRQLTRRLAGAMIVAGAAAALAFVLHFVSVVGFEPLLSALRARAGERSAAHVLPYYFVTGYADSFGAFLLFVAALGVVFNRLDPRPRIPRWVFGVLVAATVPLVENVILAQHSATYHYDHLKVLVALILFAATAITLFRGRLQQAALVAWVALVAWSVARPPDGREIKSNPPIASNAGLLRALKARAKPCAVYTTEGRPRGWMTLTLGANAYEEVPTVDSMRRIVAARGACQGIHLAVGLYHGEAMYVWNLAAVYDPVSGLTDTIPWTPSATSPTAGR